MMALQNLSPTSRVLLEGLGAMVVVTVLETESDFSTQVPAEVKEKLLAIATHQSSLFAEHAQKEDAIYHLHQERLRPFLDPNANTPGVIRGPTKRVSIPVAANKEPAPSRGWFGGWLGGKGAAAKVSESEFLEDEGDGGDAKSSASSSLKTPTSLLSRPIAAADVLELCANLMGVDAEEFSHMMNREGNPPEASARGSKERNWPGERSKHVELENRLVIADEKEHPPPPLSDADIQEKYQLFPDWNKFLRSTTFPSLDSLTLKKKGANLVCGILGSHAEVSRHLDALETDFTNSHDVLALRWIDVSSNWQSPKEVMGKALSDTYIGALGVFGFLFGLRKAFPPLGGAAEMDASMFTKGFLRSPMWRRVAFSPLGLLPLGALLAGPLLSNERGMKLLRYITVEGDKKEEEEGKDKAAKGKKGESIPFLLDSTADSIMSRGAGTSLEQPVSAERLEYLIIDKPIAEQVLFTGVIFRSLMLIPGLNATGRLAAHLITANFFAEWQAERPAFTPVSGWFKDEGGVSDMGLYSLSFLQALAMQYLYTTTSTTVIGLARPIGWSVFLYALMALNETKDALTHPYTRLETIPLYNTAVKAMVKQYQAEYFRLSRQTVNGTDEAIKRASLHCTAYMFWLRDLAPPLRVAFDSEKEEKGNDKAGEGETEGEVDPQDRLAQSLMVEKRYKQSLERLKSKEGDDKPRQEITLVDLHSFLMEAEHMLSALTLYEIMPAPSLDSPKAAPTVTVTGKEKEKYESPLKLRPLSLFDDRAIQTLETLTNLNSHAVNQTTIAVPAADDRERERATAALLSANRARVEQAAPSGKHFQDPLVRGYLDLLYSTRQHAFFEFLKTKYRGKPLTFDKVESELPKLLSMVDAQGEKSKKIFSLRSSALSPQQLLEQLPKVIHANEKSPGGYPSSRDLPSLLDYAPSSWNDVESDVTHEALLDVVEALYSRMRTQRLQEARNFAVMQRDQFWLRRAGVGRPTKRDMESMRHQMLDHVMSKTGKSAHDFLANLGLTRYKLYLCINRCSAVDSSKQLKRLAEDWEKYLNSREHFDEINKAFLQDFMKGKQPVLYLSEH